MMRFLNLTKGLHAFAFLANPDHVLVSMCQSASTDRCLILMVRSSSSYFAFYDDDCNISAAVTTNHWHHFDFVYDNSITTQYIYFNGYLVCRRISLGPFLGNSCVIIVGARNMSGTASPSSFWTGYIDQLSYVARAKTAMEILTDATLVAYYSFDNGWLDDSGPNKINGVSDRSIIVFRLVIYIDLLDGHQCTTDQWPSK